MECDVIVVGAGIGGLTTAALLAARGVDVCLFERQSRVGGCVANFEHLGFTFEPTLGLYSGWEADGTWERVFSELRTPAPKSNRLSPNYVVRLPGGQDVAVTSDKTALEQEILTSFPDCGDAAVRFFRLVNSDVTDATNVEELLGGMSRKFRRFVDAQLRAFAQCTSDQTSFERVAATLRTATGPLWSIAGGAQALANQLAESFKGHGGSLRLNSTVLRLAYGNAGTPVGVDLLSGERVIAKRGIVSNLTVWDTYGKLIGPSRTAREIASELKTLSAWGAYLIFLAVDEAASGQLPAPRTLLIHDDTDQVEHNPESLQLMLNLGSVDYAPSGKRPLTAVALTRADEWFAFHEDHAWHEAKDQAQLESWWTKLHQALPMLGDSVEVIETSTPQTVYETLRRRFGMVGRPNDLESPAKFATPFDNVFLVGDTVSTGIGLEGVASSARKVADKIALLSPHRT
jgi:phytoene dehydrogenase-like protein